jgi:isopentenyl-diphosphate Delta-isomerase
MQVEWIEEIAPYRYTFTKDGDMENEICPIHVGFTSSIPELNPDEVEAIEWISWPDFLEEIKNNTDKYSPWCVEEGIILDMSEKFQQLNLF